MNQFTDNAIAGAMRFIAKGLAAGRLQTSASGLEHIPPHGPALVVARHYHHLFDGLALFAVLHRPFHIVVTLDWVQSIPSKLFMQILTGLARWPVVLRRDALIRSSLSGSAKGAGLFSPKDVIHYQRRALLQAVELLVEGRVLIVFPEGYPNIDPTYTPKVKPEEFLPFKPGFVSIITAAEKRLRTKLPIIPLGIRYCAGKTWVAQLVFGEVIYRAQFADSASLVKCVENAVKKLSGLIAYQDKSKNP
jgi:1-acyl-sn-glycerol-3-phosphate acyltransferase